MPSINKVELVGNVANINFGVTNSGSEMATMTVCTDRKYTNSKGEEKKEVEFHKVTCWSKLAENAKKYIEKNTLVYIEGRLSNKKWTTPEGEDRYGYEVVASKVLVLRNPNYNPMDKAEDAMEKEINNFIKEEK